MYLNDFIKCKDAMIERLRLTWDVFKFTYKKISTPYLCD